MELQQGLLLVILAPHLDYEIYANIIQTLDDSIMIEIKSNPEVPFDKDLLCIVVEEDNIFEFYTRAITKDGNIILIRKPVLDGYSVIEKRKFNRADCNIGFVATPVSINNVLIPNSDKRFTGVIKNISAGGVLVESNLNLPVDMVFSFKLKLNFFMDCKAKVIRTTKMENGEGYLAGCQFIDSTIENIKTISLYAFKEKLKVKRKELNERKVEKVGKDKIDGEK